MRGTYQPSVDEGKVLLFVTCLYNLLFTTLNHLRLLF